LGERADACLWLTLPISARRGRRVCGAPWGAVKNGTDVGTLVSFEQIPGDGRLVV